jgi:hypothetical protein
MDAANPFETPVTYRLHRTEYLIGLVVITAMIVVHFHDIRWLPFLALFLSIDLIGYIPGAVAFHRSETKRISKAYYIMYNTMHSMITQSVVIGLWSWVFGWEWALLAIPFHLFGDRGVFGNFMKSFALPFEPVPSPGYAKLIAGLRSDVTVEAGGDDLVELRAHPRRHAMDASVG